MEKQFSTIDFYAAAALVAENYELVDYYRLGGFTTFLFNETPDLNNYIKNTTQKKLLSNLQNSGELLKI
ncbi:MAG: hypothetical protein WDA75_19590 [Candidatus Latescibacterota bacterium]|jgi:abortive infection bacteriophage resistance protein|nr:hypothetical protein [Ignavibacteriaceae bacterium]